MTDDIRCDIIVSVGLLWLHQLSGNEATPNPREHLLLRIVSGRRRVINGVAELNLDWKLGI